MTAVPAIAIKRNFPVPPPIGTRSKRCCSPTITKIWIRYAAYDCAASHRITGKVLSKRKRKRATSPNKTLPIVRSIRRNQSPRTCDHTHYEKHGILRQMRRFRPKEPAQAPPVAWPEGTDQIIGRRNEHHGGNDPRDTQPASHTQGFAHGKPEKGIRQRIEKQVFHEPEVPDLHMPGSRRAQNRKNDQGKSQMKQLDGHETPKSVAVAAGRDEVARNKEVKPHEKRSVYRKEVPQPHGTFGQ